MKGDFSRITFDAANHFSRVLMQQGRVTLDADPNEQADILLHYLRTLARDLIGPCGGPADALGFQLEIVPASGTARVPWTLNIRDGRYYVDGILCENHASCAYASQPDYTPPQGDPLLTELARATPSTTAFWLYLDVWERHITPVEDDRMREVALGGPDTCTRAKVIWQVKALALDVPEGQDACTAQLASLTTLSTGRMAAELDPGPQIKDPCVIAPDARYRGAENQLYRVEIHRGGSLVTAEGKAETTSGPTFKWSRDNGSVATAWLGTDGHDLVVASARGFSAGNWVELSDDVRELRGEPGVLVKLSSVDGNRLRVDTGTPPPAWTSDLKQPRVRRWDQTENDDVTLTEGAISLTGAPRHGWIDLEDGVRVTFGAGDYRTGDYWLIPARVATGDIEWPRTDGRARPQPPRGIRHHYAPLGWLVWRKDDSGKDAWIPTSCLCTLNPLGSCERPGEPRPSRRAPQPAQPQLQPSQPAPPQPSGVTGPEPKP